MGCFSSCFGGSKAKQHVQRPRHVNPAIPRDQRNGVYEPLRINAVLNEEVAAIPVTPVVPLEVVAKPIRINLNPVVELEEKLEEEEKPLSLNVKRKVTFNLDVKTYEEDVAGKSGEDDGEEEGGEMDECVPSSAGFSYPVNHRYQNCDDDDDYVEEIEEEEDSDVEDDEEVDEVVEVLEEEELCDEKGRVEIESSESLFSLPIRSTRYGNGSGGSEKEVNSPIKVVKEEGKVSRSNESGVDRKRYMHSVLSPVENLTQWKVVKGKPANLSIKHLKENLVEDQELQIPFSPEPSFKLSPFQSQKKEFETSEQKQAQVPLSSERSLKLSPFRFSQNIDHSTPPKQENVALDASLKLSPFRFSKNHHHSTPPKQEVAVDTSLSTWLTSDTNSANTSTFSIGIGSADVSKPRGLSSPRSHEDRPILGALTVQELQEFSATSSPRRSPTRSPDDMPIVGSVGSYWKHTGQASSDSSSASSAYKGIPNTTSKYREDKSVNWHSTPFEKRLERALNTGAAEAYSRH